jgi:hypothetical protein
MHVVNKHWYQGVHLGLQGFAFVILSLAIVEDWGLHKGVYLIEILSIYKIHTCNTVPVCAYVLINSKHLNLPLVNYMLKVCINRRILLQQEISTFTLFIPI